MAWRLAAPTADCRARTGLQHIRYHHADSILLDLLLTWLALVIGRLHSIRYLHRSTHPGRSAEELCRLLWPGRSRAPAHDSS